MRHHVVDAALDRRLVVLFVVLALVLSTIAEREASAPLPGIHSKSVLVSGSSSPDLRCWPSCRRSDARKSAGKVSFIFFSASAMAFSVVAG